MDLLDTQVYSIIGEDGFVRLIAAFYRRVPTDDILGPMYKDRDLAGAEQRLCGFLIQRFGGPDHYSQQRGHPRLRMRHAPFHIDKKGRDRWIELMEQALAETKLPAEPEKLLRAFFHDSATFMINR
jgi:hemoglobin